MFATLWAFLPVIILLLVRFVEAGFDLSPGQTSLLLACFAWGVILKHSVVDAAFWHYCVGEDSPDMRKLRADRRSERDKMAQTFIFATVTCSVVYHLSRSDLGGAMIPAMIATLLFLLKPSQGKYVVYFINVFAFNLLSWKKCGGPNADSHFLWSPVLLIPIWNTLVIESASLQVGLEMWRLSVVIFFCSEAKLGLAIGLLSVATLIARGFEGQHDLNLLFHRRADRRISECIENERRQLVGVLSHEIRNRLDILTNLVVERVTSGSNKKPGASAHDKSLVEQTALMQKSVTVVLDLLDIERIGGVDVAVTANKGPPLPKTARVNLSLLIHSAQQLQLRDDSVRTNSSFHVCIDGNLQHDVFCADKDRLHMILCHLMANAYNGCADARDSKVTVSAIPQHGFPAKGANSDTSSSVIFEVVNTGQPHSQECLDNAMRWHMQKNSRVRRWGGHGLGLRHVQAILTQLQCPPLELTARGDSVTARFVIPCEGIEVSEERCSDPTSVTDSKLVELSSILVVDDMKLIRTMSTVQLKKTFPGVHIIEAENGVEAVRSYRKRRRSDKADFDLIVMDIQMPVLCGDEAVRKIRVLETQYQYPRALIMARTANTSQSDCAHYEACGLDGCIPKGGNVAKQISEAMHVKRERPSEFIIL